MVFVVESSACRFKSRCFPTVQKRFTHRASSHAYLKEWERHKVDFVDKLGSSHQGKHLTQSPQLVAQILKTESAMKQRKFVPFVHAMPASSKVLLELYKTASSPDKPFVKRLRSPFEKRKSLSELRRSVPQTEDRVQRPEFLSASYALTSNTVPLESAASWGFANHFGREQYSSMQSQLEFFVADLEKRADKKLPEELVQRAKDLIRVYNRLEVGDFYVLGVPPSKLSSWMYDAKPYYVPTGRDIQDVARTPRTTAEEGTIATLLLAHEVLQPDSGLIAVEANNPLEVEQFAYGLRFRPPEEVSAFRAILREKATPFEASENALRTSLDRELDSLISDVKRWLHGSPSLEWDGARDCPSLLP